MLIRLLCLSCLLATCTPTKNDQNLLHDVLQAIRKVLEFFKSDIKEINLDALFGLRVAQGQLADILQDVLDGMVKLPLSLRVEVTSLVTRMESISRKVNQNLGDTDYYRAFEPVVRGPWNASYSKRHVRHAAVPHFDPKILKIKIHNYDERRGDQCFKEMFGTVTLPNSRKFVPKCTIRPGCIDYLIKGKVNGYHLTHQLLYLEYGQQNCTQSIEKITGKSMEGLLTDRCTRAYGEAVTLVDSGIPHNLRDYFMEDYTVCGMIGYQEFFRPDWMRLIMSFQMPSGCFGEERKKHVVQKRSDGYFFGSRAGMRKLLVESLMRGNCLSHASGLGLSSLAVSARSLLENYNNVRPIAQL